MREDRKTFIDVQNWGDEGQIYWAPGRHDEAEFREAIAALNKTMGLCDDEAEIIAEVGVQHIYARYTIPSDPAALGQYVDHPMDSEQVYIGPVDEGTPGSFAVTWLRWD